MDGARFQNWFSRNIWDFRAGTVSLENPNTPINGWTIDQILGGAVNSTGQVIGYDTSLTISAVYRSAAILEGIVSSLPFQAFKPTDDGRVQIKPSEHSVAGLFNRKVNSQMTKVVYLTRAVDHFLFWGNHIGLITFNGIGRAVSIELVHPKDVSVHRDDDGQVAYKIKNVPVPAYRVLHVPNLGDDIWGKGIITKAREDFGMQMNTRQYGSNFYAKGGRPAGIISPKENVKLTDPQRLQIENAWIEGKKRGGDVVLPAGLEYQAISIPPDDAAWLATNQFGVATVARWFGVPPQKLAELGRATFNNVEAMAIEFLQDTIWPICEKFEAEYTAKLFPLASEQDYYLEFNLDAYQRADSVAKAQLFATYIQNGIKKPNEIRKLNNDEADPNGNDLMIQSGTVPIRLLEQSLLQPKAAPAKRNKRYSLPEIQKILSEKYKLTNEQLDFFANNNGNGNGH